MTNEPENHEKKSTGTANSSGSAVSHSSGFEKAKEANPALKKMEGNPFGVSNPDADNIPTGAPQAEGEGTGSPHISENPDKQ